MFPQKACPQRLRTLRLAFLYPGPDDPWLNRVVARVSHNPVCHVELVFEDEMSFSIFQGSRLFFKPRTFSNPEYQLVSLNVSNAEYSAAYAFCEGAIRHDLGFTDLGMLGSYFQPTGCPICCYSESERAGYTYCSKIVTEALLFAGLPEVEKLHPCTTTPSFLLDAVRDSPRCVIDSNQFRRQLFFETGVIVRINQMGN